MAHPGTPRITVGVDTHLDVHVAHANDQLGRRVDTVQVPTTPTGYHDLLAWARGLGEPVAWGVEGTGSYGAALARFLVAGGQVVLEVNRPDRSARRRRGKSDPVDAQAAARAVQAGEVTVVPKAGDGHVEMIRSLRVARQTALRARAHRHQALSAEISSLTTELDRLTAKAAPKLVALFGVGQDSAGALLVAAGDNPDRLRSDAAFSMLCGVSPIEASSGKTTRHRLNRGGDRQANAALYRIVMVRLCYDPATKDYMARRLKEGKSKKEVIRCLKRYVAREVFAVLHQMGHDTPTAAA